MKQTALAFIIVSLFLVATSAPTGEDNNDLEVAGDHRIDKRSPDHHDEYETIAQSVCSSMAIARNRHGWTYAVHRVCQSGTSTCQQICESPFLRTQDTQTAFRTWTCIGAVHVYKNRPSSTPGTAHTAKIGLKVYWSSNYHQSTHCGPNFCCCHA